MSRTLLRQITKRLKRASQMNSAELNVYQESRFRALLHHAIQHAPYYRKVMAELDPKRVRLEDLPTLSKDLLMRHFDEIVTHPDLKLARLNEWVADQANLGKLFKDRWLVMRTSGTTGEPAVIVSDLKNTMLYQAVMNTRSPVKRPSPLQILKLVIQGLFKPWPMVGIMLSSGNYSSGYVSMLHLPKPPRFLDFQIINLIEPLPEMVKQLNQIQPVGLYGTASILDTLASEQLEGRLNLKFDAPFASISSAGETLYPGTRDKVRRAWGLEIQNTYGNTECGVIAKSCCDFEHMHVMSDICILEVVDEQNRPVPKGTLGAKVLVTNLINMDLPLIRYEVNDIIAYAEEDHDCGVPFPLLKTIEGRSDQNFHLESESGQVIMLRHEHFILFSGMECIQRFQVIQVGRNHFTLKYIVAKDFKGDPQSVRQTIKAGIDQLPMPVEIQFTLEQVDDFPLAPNGKFKMFMCEYQYMPNRPDFRSNR